MESTHRQVCAAIALGSNVASTAGSPAATLSVALGELAQRGLVLAAVSRFFATPAYPPGSGPEFVNAAALLTGATSPEALLSVLHGVEAGFGRNRSRAERWAPRVLDLDLIYWGDRILPDPATAARWRGLAPERQRTEAPEALVLPHPRLQDRGFVLIPLADIAPLWRHPATGASIAEMAAALPAAELAAIRPLAVKTGL